MDLQIAQELSYAPPVQWSQSSLLCVQFGLGNGKDSEVMMIDIPESVRGETKICPHDFACLATGRCGDPEKCNVDHALEKNLLLLTSNELFLCGYRIYFGSRLLCTCPTHYAICQQRAL